MPPGSPQAYILCVHFNNIIGLRSELSRDFMTHVVSYSDKSALLNIAVLSNISVLHQHSITRISTAKESKPNRQTWLTFPHTCMSTWHHLDDTQTAPPHSKSITRAYAQPHTGNKLFLEDRKVDAKVNGASPPFITEEHGLCKDIQLFSNICQSQRFVAPWSQHFFSWKYAVLSTPQSHHSNQWVPNNEGGVEHQEDKARDECDEDGVQ